VPKKFRSANISGGNDILSVCRAFISVLLAHLRFEIIAALKAHMITLPKDIQEAVRTSEDQPIRLTDPETHSEYVVVPANLYDQLQELFYEHTLTQDEKRSLMLQAGKRAVWDDPEMDVYNDLDPRRQQ